MKKVLIVKSNIHGRGLVAAKDIKRGELVGIIKGPVMHRVNKTIRDVFDNPDWVGFGKNYWVDPEPPFKYLNHSCDANCGVKGTRSLYAVRNIKKDEEITLDYSTTETDERWYLDCNCGSMNCRKKPGPIQTLPKKIFSKYYPFIPTYNKEYYSKYCV